MSVLTKFVKWVHLKQYQIEVTYSVYMFTPIERFVFWSVVFLLFGLTFIATTLYLPQHIVFLLNRAWFYVNGDSVDVLEMTKEAVQELALSARNAGAGTTTAATVVEAAKEAAETIAKAEL